MLLDKFIEAAIRIVKSIGDFFVLSRLFTGYCPLGLLFLLLHRYCYCNDRQISLNIICTKSELLIHKISFFINLSLIIYNIYHLPKKTIPPCTKTSTPAEYPNLGSQPATKAQKTNSNSSIGIL